jgi:hypothetical protein
VSGLLSTGKEEVRAGYDKCLICGWDYVKERGWNSSAIKSERFLVGVAEIVDTAQRLRILHHVKIRV